MATSKKRKTQQSRARVQTRQQADKRRTGTGGTGDTGGTETDASATRAAARRPTAASGRAQPKKAAADAPPSKPVEAERALRTTSTFTQWPPAPAPVNWWLLASVSVSFVVFTVLLLLQA